MNTNPNQFFHYKSYLTSVIVFVTIASQMTFAQQGNTAALSSPSPIEKKEYLNLNVVDKAVRNKVEQSYPYIFEREPTYIETDDIISNLANTFNIGFRIERRGKDLFLIEQKVPLIKKIQFSGLTILTTREALQMIELSENDIFSLDYLVDVSQRLQDYFKTQGYLNTSIDIDYPQDTDGNYNVTFHVKENSPTLIKNIIIENEDPELVQILKKVLNSRIKDPFRESTLSDMFKEMREQLAKNGYYQTAINNPKVSYNQDETEATLIFKFDNTNSYTFEFTGNKKFTSSRLQEVLELENFYSAAPNLSLELETKLRNFYLSKGYAKVEVLTETREGRTPQKLYTSFQIHEDNIIRIKKLNFTGRWSQNEKHYTDLFYEFAPEIIQDNILSKNDLDLAVKNFIIQLQNKGFLTAKVNSTKTTYDKDNSSLVFISINFDEGPLTTIKNIVFEGTSAFTSAQLLEKAKLGAIGTPLHLNALEQAIANIKNNYYENGYIEMLILNEKDLVRYNENNTEATLVFSIFEGPRVQIDSIVYEGNRITHDKVILAELELKVGDYITPSKVEESIARLQRTGFFSQVEIRTLEEKSMISQRTLLVRVKERDPGTFTIGVGANNEYGFTIHGYTGVGYRNIGGWGRAISARAEGNYNLTQFKYFESKITLGFLEPYLFESRTRFRLNLTRSNDISDFDQRKVTHLNYSVASLEQDVTSHMTVIFDVLGVATYVDQGLDSSSQIPRKDLVIASTGPTVDIDYRDNPFNPSRGFFSKINFEVSTENLGSSKVDEFFRANASLTHYFLLNQKAWVWANSIRGGYLTDIRRRGFGIPYDKKGFSLGGRSTIRGFEASEAFPRSKDIGEDYALDSTSSYELFKSEVRIPVYKEIGLAFFYDGGRVVIQGLKTETFSPEWRHSAGFGARYNTPIGPVNADLGIKLNPKKDESPWAFHLSIGSF